MAVNLKEKLERWKTNLLDMSKRNPLLNFRFRKGINLKIVEPSFLELWDSFVQKEQKITFPLVNEKAEAAAAAAAEAAGEDAAKAAAKKPATRTKAKAGSAVTDDTPGERQRALRNLKKKSQLFQEEQGINVLYMAFGFLRWNEKNGAKAFFDAPLILVPVDVTWENIRAPFVLGLHEDEIVLNPTLKFMLEDTYGVKVPEFDSETGLGTYMQQLKEAIGDNSEWSIVEDIGVGLFHFLKLSMYDDLKRNEEAILNSKLVRAVAGDKDAIDFNIPDFSNLDGSGELDPMKTFQVVDADSSQQEAVLCAKKGVSFVLQGPPGTGKSQTITNIIAECLANGKKVLFVAEKMAALEVVYRRLASAGLGDFCLIMHSHKANKKSIMNQFEQVLHRSEQKITVKNDAFQELVRLDSYKQLLNRYSNAIYTKISPLNKTLHDAFGELARLAPNPDIIFPIDNVRQMTEDRYLELLETLRAYVRSLEAMSGDLGSNPWAGANKVTALTNELREDIMMNLQRLQTATRQLGVLANNIKAQFGFDVSESHAGLLGAQQMLRSILDAQNVPSSWILGGDTSAMQAEIATGRSAQAYLAEASKNIAATHEALKSADPEADFTAHENLNSKAAVQAHQEAISNFINGNPIYRGLIGANGDPATIERTIGMLKERADGYAEIKVNILKEFQRGIFDLDAEDLYRKFRGDYDSMFKMFNSDYKRDKQLIESMCIRIGAELSDEYIVSLLGKLRQMGEYKKYLEEKEPLGNELLGSAYQGVDTDFEGIRRRIGASGLVKNLINQVNAIDAQITAFEENGATLKEHFGDRYTGIDTDWDGVEQALAWAANFRAAIAQMPDKDAFAQKICSGDPALRSLAEQSLTQLNGVMDTYTTSYANFTSLFDNPESFSTQTFAELDQRYENCLSNIMQLQDWIDHKDVVARCAANGLSEFVKQCEANNLKNDQIVPAFEERFYKLWVDSVMVEYPSVATFRRKQQEALIEEFRSLDKKQLDVAKSRITADLTNKLPAFNSFTSGGDEISILKRELAKQRRIMPVRRLFQKIPNLIRMLKPCLMMSPLTVSLFLESKDFNFDTVIFDEASQVCTENAIGAILRGKQVIIAGDSKQMPPTSFFSVSAEGDSDEYDENNEEANDIFESLLDEASLLPQKTLLWHYRSRHEHLIAFSNVKIYQNRLVTFPSWMKDMPDVGVEYVHVPEGVYDRGGRKGNVNEAQKVAEMVFEHFEACKQGRFNRTLGVIAFGMVQQQAIENQIRRMRAERPEYEEFFNENVEEPFFIKSLENVQGDERDTIIFSIGYAKGPDGKMVMNFGPLGQQGGERRLNVAITRAKINIKLVGSILPTDIDVNRVSTEGPKLLRGYMEFAINGPQSLIPDTQGGPQFDSPIEQSIYELLVNNGYEGLVDTRVGCSNYRIDLAVKHPDHPDSYVIAIECDGASYHASKTARERDRIRPDVMKGMGWKLYRVWSPDWVKDPEGEGRNLLEAVKEAIDSFKVAKAAPAGSAAKPKAEEAKEEMVVVTDAKEEADADNPYHFDACPDVELPADMSSQGPNGRKACLKYLIDNCFPVHVDDLYKALARGEKLNAQMKAQIQADLMALEQNELYKNSHDFYLPPVIKEMPVRVAGPRTIAHIAQEEIEAALIRVAQMRVGINHDALVTEAMHGFGFKRKNPKLNEAFALAYENLKARGKISEDEEGTVSLA